MTAAGEPNAFGAAVAGEIPRLRRVARSLVRQPEAVEDLVQDTLLRAIVARQQFVPGTDLQAWLVTILHNRRRAEVRREARSPITPVLREPPGGIEADPVSGGQEERAAMRDLAAALARLPRTQRQALALVAGEGLGYAAAARRLRIPLGTLRSRLSRARARLRRVEGSGGEAEERPPSGGHPRG